MALSPTFTPTTADEMLAALACGRAGCACSRSLRVGHGLTHCPAHQDTVPSFSVGPRRDGADGAAWNCFSGCSSTATTDALKGLGLLGRRSDLTAPAPVRVPVAASPKVSIVPDAESRLMAWAMDLYREIMPRSPGARYIRSRGLPDAPEAGWAPGGKFLMGRVGPDGQKVTLEELVAAGLVYGGDGRGRGMDVLRERVVFPYTWYGRTTCLQGRAIDPGTPKEDRYRFTAFQGRWERGLFRETAIKTPCFAVVEGALDAIALTSLCGIPALALGSVRYLAGIQRLSRLPRTKLVVLGFDRDDANPANPGETACREVGDALASGPRIAFTRPQLGHKDWADVAQERVDQLRRGEKPAPFRLADRTFTPTPPTPTRPEGISPRAGIETNLSPVIR